jgi:hypothetical protein
MIRRVMLGAAVAIASVVVLAGDSEGPIFLRWLVPGSPLDETIAVYWQRAEAGELDAPGLVDLGTMLWEKGFPRDAVRVYERALELDPDLAEAWFRIGLVHHREGEVRRAEKAYHKCLKVLTGHGWCNFYLGLLEEQTGKPSEAIQHFRRAFKFAPELADPKVNPEVLSSRLALAGRLQNEARTTFGRLLPLTYLEPDEVARVRLQYEPAPPAGEVAAPSDAGAPPPPTPAPTRTRLQPVGGRLGPPAAGPPPAAGDPAAGPAAGPSGDPASAGVAPRIRSVSPESPAVAIRPAGG